MPSQLNGVPETIRPGAHVLSTQLQEDRNFKRPVAVAVKHAQAPQQKHPPGCERSSWSGK